MLIFILLFILAVIIIVGVALVIVSTRKKTCDCLGKSCNGTDGCGNVCCDDTKNQKCVNGVCCSSDCSDKTCSDKNGCGESCESAVCGNGQKCFQGNCCASQCDGKTCENDGCGGTCPCPKGQTCYQGTCCIPPVCDGTFCGDACGMNCNCNDRYCYPGSCCSNSSCTYKDICNSPVGSMLKGQWAKFCDVCEECNLRDTVFQGDAVVPFSGTLNCTHCDGKNVGNVKIDPMALYYEYNKDSNNPVIVPRYDSVRNCDNVSCGTDNDCKRFACTTCVGTKCV